MERFTPIPSWNEESYLRAKEQARPKRLKCGASILDYAQREIDMSLNLLGNRWLSRGCGGFIVAPSGHGKSTLVIQMAIGWSCGKPCCGIAPARPLRVFIAQAEDDYNDIIEMAQMINRMGLGDRDAELVRLNTHVEWLCDCTGTAFFGALREILEAEPEPFDLLIINPYTAYQTDDIQDSAANGDFLRSGLGKLMTEFSLGCLIVHHTAKTQFQNKKDFAWFDFMYDMAGSATLTNWARAVLIVTPSELPGTYKFIAAKRFEKIGWQQREYWFSHSVQNGHMLWIPANADQIASAKKSDELLPDDLLVLFSPLEPVTQADLILHAKLKFSIGRDRTRDFISSLIASGKIEVVKIPRPNARAELAYLKI